MLPLPTKLLTYAVITTKYDMTQTNYKAYIN